LNQKQVFLVNVNLDDAHRQTWHSA
jgi:hypothetical protein